MVLNHVAYQPKVFDELGSARPVAGWDGTNAPHVHDAPSGGVWSRFADLFTERIAEGKEHRYRLSVAVAECMFGDPFAGVLYPSIAMWANAGNVALQPDWADSNLRYVGVEAIRVNEIEAPKIHVDVFDYATSSDGVHLDWKGRGPTWQLRERGAQLRVESTGEIWRAFDEMGREVDPE